MNERGCFEAIISEFSYDYISYIYNILILTSYQAKYLIFLFLLIHSVVLIHCTTLPAFLSNL